jgi:hypothetical protein
MTGGLRHRLMSVVPSLPEQNTVLKDQLLEDPSMQ